jgi:segregation and condensation protein A
MILEKLASESNVAFERVFDACENRIHAIVTFLALLELLNMQRVHLTQGIGANNFWLNLRDDWVEEQEVENGEAGENTSTPVSNVMEENNASDSGEEE